MTESSELELKRSAVRRYVTYGAVAAYLLTAMAVVGVLLWKENFELAISVLGTIAAMTGPIVGFWFGTRKPAI